MSVYTAYDWYWIIGGSTIYSSSAGKTVAADDATYVAWQGGGANRATPVPDAATLDFELAHAGLPLSGLVPPTTAQLLAYANAKLNELLAVSRPYNLAAAGGGSASTVKSDATTATGADLLALNVWASTNPTATQPWVDDFGAVTTLTGAQFQALGLAVQGYGASVWAIMASAASGIASATITTTAEIDALSWPA